jgi:hypothetical protein
MPTFDAQAARALARRTRGVGEILADVKQAIVRAAEQGGFEAVVPLPDAQHVPPGASTNNASFLVSHLQERGLPAWAEAVQHATRAGYDVRPSWTPLPEGAGCDGLLLSWSLVLDEPQAQPLLMSAHLAYRMAMSARAAPLGREGAGGGAPGRDARRDVVHGARPRADRVGGVDPPARVARAGRVHDRARAQPDRRRPDHPLVKARAHRLSAPARCRRCGRTS